MHFVRTVHDDISWTLVHYLRTCRVELRTMADAPACRDRLTLNICKLFKHTTDRLFDRATPRLVLFELSSSEVGQRIGELCSATEVTVFFYMLFSVSDTYARVCVHMYIRV